MGANGDACFLEVNQVRKAEYLVATAIGEHGAVPSCEPLDPAQCGNARGTGLKRQMIGIPKDTVGVCRSEIRWSQTFDGANRAHRHEGGCGDVAMWSANASNAGTRLLTLNKDLK